MYSYRVMTYRPIIDYLLSATPCKNVTIISRALYVPDKFCFDYIIIHYYEEKDHT